MCNFVGAALRPAPTGRITQFSAYGLFGFLSQDLIRYVAHELHLPLARVYGVATFYHRFSFKPLGEHTCIVCLGTACYVKGASEIVAALEQAFNLKSGQTTPDGKLSISSARCLGSCGLAPVTVLDGSVVGKQTSDSAIRRVRALIGDNRPDLLRLAEKYDEGSVGSDPAGPSARGKA